MLRELKEEFENTTEPRLDEMIQYFETHNTQITISNIQRCFRMGYNRAYRAKQQLLQRGFE